MRGTITIEKYVINTFRITKSYVDKLLLYIRLLFFRSITAIDVAGEKMVYRSRCRILRMLTCMVTTLGWVLFRLEGLIRRLDKAQSILYPKRADAGWSSG